MRQWLQCASWERRTRQDTRVGEGLTLDLLITLLKCNNGVWKSLITSSSIEIKSTGLEWLTTFYTEFLNKSQILFMPQKNIHVHRLPGFLTCIRLRADILHHQRSPQRDDAWTSTTGRCGTITSLAAIKVGAVVGHETVLCNVAVFTHTRTHTLTSTSVRTVSQTMTSIDA